MMSWQLSLLLISFASALLVPFQTHLTEFDKIVFSLDN